MMDRLIARLITQQKRATPAELVNIANHVAAAPFAIDLLEADESLWGSFWQFDVIAPGYTLPTIELALLRATRLDGHWPEDTTPDQFLADLRQVILRPKAGIWTLSVVGEPCIIFATYNEQDENPKSPQSCGLRREIPNPKLITVVWYCASTGQLHAGYRVETRLFHFAGAVEQRQPQFKYYQEGTNDTPSWLTLAVQQLDITEDSSLPTRIDAEILQVRLGG